MNRFADRLLALLLLAIGAACFAMAYLAHGGEVADEAFTSVRLAVFGAAGIVSAVAAVLFWAGLLPGRPSHASAAPLFGRAAETQDIGRPRLRQVFLVLPVVALLVLVADRFWSGKSPDEAVAPGEPEGQDIANAPPAPAPANPPAAAPVPAPSPPAPPEQAAETSPKPARPAPPAAAPAVPVQPPEVALAPPAPISPPAVVSPPETVAPLPQPPPPLPTEPDGHRDAVVWLAVAPDGHSILSASTDHTIKLWDIGGKRLIRTLGVHKDMARTALFMPGGVSALTAGDDGEIVQRRLSDGAVLHVFSSGGNGGVNKLAISPDGKRAVSGHDTGTVIVWDIEKGSVLHVMTGHDWSISAVAVSPDGARAVSGSIDGTLKLWDIGGGKQLRSWRGHEEGTYGAVFTADGHHLVTGSGDDTIKLWDLDSGREVRRFDGHSGTVYALVLSADGQRLLSGSLDGTARLWDMDSGNEITMFDSQTGPIYAVAFAADGTVLTGGYDRTIREWPAAGGDGVVLFAGAPD
ncbi:WD40 repeat domain-containing protein [Mesorhizobium sp. YC-39]|uniref:WD40 repeat domain-containing protein n=1 Tax=unclassified Mesorhizobium TaxID=325217 RepID=UPI0021E8B7A9|nr:MULTISPECIES: WD40 repeat domain-containing protein [unclassified Mesorhizobium]MCV3209340.1 WD40 repeat domain-containing protein [Mesorhizobium sp. YC-2]MCV3231310.1 WD40 repeat domain-containing protein [Mesorhizobium sp. YC-39]